VYGKGVGEKTRERERELGLPGERVTQSGSVTQEGKSENSWGIKGATRSLGLKQPLAGNTMPTNTSKL